MYQYAIDRNPKNGVNDAETSTDLSHRCHYSVADCGDGGKGEED